MKCLTTTFFICCFLLFQSCTIKDRECGPNCSLEYRTIVIKIKDQTGNPMVLDSFKVVELRNGRDISLLLDEWTYQYQRERGFYPIFSDKYMEDYRQQIIQIEFTGFIEDREVVSRIFKVGADCCHVHHVSGDLELVI